MAFSYPKWNTFIIPVIRPDLIERCLDTLYANTEHDTFYVYVVDQTKNGLNLDRDKYHGLMVLRTPVTDFHTTGNLGFAKANNMAIQLVTTPYFTMCNDDVEFINMGWWQGVLDAFMAANEAIPDRPAMMVNPSSIKLPDWSVGRAHGDDFYILPYKEEYSEEDWRFLIDEDHYINEHLTLKPGSAIDGVTLYCSVIDTEKFLDVGYLDESYYPGGAEDYDYCCRAYMRGYRCLGTTMSYVYHHWSKSLNSSKDIKDVESLVQDDLRMGDHNKIWDEKRFDIWGIRCDVKDCEERLRTTDNKIAICPKHPESTYDIPQVKIQPL